MEGGRAPPSAPRLSLRGEVPLFRKVFALLSLLSVAGCNAQVGGAPLVSGMSPAAPLANNSEPQPPNSLPPGAAGLQSAGPNSTVPNAASVTVGGRGRAP